MLPFSEKPSLNTGNIPTCPLFIPPSPWFPSETIQNLYLQALLTCLFLINHPPWKTSKGTNTEGQKTTCHPQDLFFLLSFHNKTLWVMALSTATHLEDTLPDSFAVRPGDFYEQGCLPWLLSICLLVTRWKWRLNNAHPILWVPCLRRSASNSHSD